MALEEALSGETIINPVGIEMKLLLMIITKVQTDGVTIIIITETITKEPSEIAEALLLRKTEAGVETRLIRMLKVNLQQMEVPGEAMASTLMEGLGSGELLFGII